MARTGWTGGGGGYMEPTGWRLSPEGGAARRLRPVEGRERLGAREPGGPRGELSYSTVVTIVSRLHAKGMLARQGAGPGFSYPPPPRARPVLVRAVRPGHPAAARTAGRRPRPGRRRSRRRPSLRRPPSRRPPSRR